LEVVSIADGYEQTFFNFVSHDPLDYYFFILDWNQRREQTKILLALNKGNIEGALLLYADYIAQFRGNRNAVKALLEHANFEKAELQAPLDCEDLISTKFTPDVKQTMVMMRLNRGEENIQITTPPTRLNAADAEDVAALMRKCDPEWWGEITAETQLKSLETACWLGIKQDNKLVSVGSTRFVDFASNIHVVATEEAYRNRGYATSIVSALVKEIFKVSPIAIIHVIADNTPAVRAYSKVGYKPYKQYLSIRGHKIRS
jgi:predicted GNAT family acetyltransferase